MDRRISVILLAGVFLLLFLEGFAAWLWFWSQDRSGHEEWNTALARVKAAGEPLDYEALIPPAIPESNNLAAIDLCRTQPDPVTKLPRMLKLDAALDKLLGEAGYQNFGSYLKGQHVDVDKLGRFIAERYQAVFHQAPTGSLLTQIDELCPALTTLREAAATRHDCRFDRDYRSQPPYARDIGDPSTLIMVAQALHLHGLAALHENRPDIAFGDLQAILTVSAGLRKEPLLVSGLVAIGDFAIAEQILWEEISTGKWSDAQLAQLQAQLSHEDFLSDGQLCLRGEALGHTLPTLDYLQRRQGSNATILRDLSSNPSNLDDAGQTLFWRIGPPGWYDLAKARTLTILYDTARALDPVAHQFHPQAIRALPNFRNTFGEFRPPVMLAGIALGPLVSGAQHFAEAQFHVDATQIAVMIERYRLAHGCLPGSLDDLSPFGVVPHDLCTGSSYHYSIRPDKTYLLYSVGWNQTDEHGELIYRKGEPTRADFKKGDWVWPQPGHPGT